jgi:hypothetical protein
MTQITQIKEREKINEQLGREPEGIPNLFSGQAPSPSSPFCTGLSTATNISDALP